MNNKKRRRGRPKGQVIPNSEKRIGRSFSMTDDEMAKVDELRSHKKLSRGRWLADDVLTSNTKLNPPQTAPKDGTLFLSEIGYPYLLPTIWNEYNEEWVVSIPQCAKMDGGNYDWWFENENEKHDTLKGWLPLPEVTNGNR